MTTIEIKIKFTQENLEDIFVTALEGGSNYWFDLSPRTVDDVRSLKLTERSFPEKLLHYVMSGSLIAVYDVESEDKIGELSRPLITERLSTLANDSAYKYALDNIMSGDFDANDADVCFQYMCLGEVVYA